ncbi:MAG: hypothetical protein RLZZ546_295, partial [Bacteroidota bacterium]
IIFICIALVSGLIRLYFLSYSTKFSYELGKKLEALIFEIYLNSSYEKHLLTDSQGITSTLTTRVSAFISCTGSLVNFFNSIIIIVTTSYFLVINASIYAIYTLIICGISYSIIVFITRRIISINSVQIDKSNIDLIESIQNMSRGIRDIILDRTQKYIMKDHIKIINRLRNPQSVNHYISNSPRITMETLGMLSIGLLTIILYKSDINQNLLLPTLGLIAITAQKLIPLMQQAYLSWSNISANESSIAELVRILDFRIKRDKYPTIRPFKFESMIEFKNVSYKYPNSQAYILKDVNLRINSGDQIAIIGASGSGKSTLIDLLMGLLTPTTGEILIDGVTLNEQNAADWQNILSHVPQSVYLFDESVQTNITISNPEIIDKLRLEQAIDFAMLNEVIDVTKNNKIGENGKFLSGGQRQRIAIARAFYKRAKIIILDEATSALDKSTKNTINNNIINYLTRNENPDDMTLITITHDLNSIDYCNIVFTVQNGMIEINKGVNNG